MSGRKAADALRARLAELEDTNERLLGLLAEWYACWRDECDPTAQIVDETCAELNE